MRRSARQLDLPETGSSPLRTGASAFLGLIMRNPTLVGGSTAFLVALSFVSANAMWYQPHAHSGAFFATRVLQGEWPKVEEADTTIRIERPVAEPVMRPKADPRIEKVQSVLKTLSFYEGEVDGLSGPATRKAIEVYQSKVGMAVTGTVDDALLDQLGASPITSGITPTPAPRGNVQEASNHAPAQPASGGDSHIIRIQAGLKAFGNDKIELDGVVGSRTKAAIKEFQSLFGLPETGEPDPAVYAKMKEIGLTN